MFSSRLDENSPRTSLRQAYASRRDLFMTYHGRFWCSKPIRSNFVMGLGGSTSEKQGGGRMPLQGKRPFL